MAAGAGPLRAGCWGVSGGGVWERTGPRCTACRPALHRELAQALFSDASDLTASRDVSLWGQQGVRTESTSAPRASHPVGSRELCGKQGVKGTGGDWALSQAWIGRVWNPLALPRFLQKDTASTRRHAQKDQQGSGSDSGPAPGTQFPLQ